MTRDATPAPTPLPTPEEIAATQWPKEPGESPEALEAHCRDAATAGARADRDAVREALLAEADAYEVAAANSGTDTYGLLCLAEAKTLRAFAASLGGSR